MPSAENGYRPKILEGQFFYIFVALLVGIKILSLVSFQEFLKAEIFNRVSQEDIVVLTNKARQDQGLPELVTNPKLQEVAKLKLADMLRGGYFSHTSPEGKTPWYWFEKADYNYKMAGENLAMDFVFSKDVVEAWMNSDSHRTNILLKEFKEIGVAVGSGNINGHETVAIVEVFGSPVEKKSAKPVVAKVSPKAATPTPKPSASPKITTTPVPTPTPTPTPSAQVVAQLKAAPISLAKEVARALVSVKGDISEKAPEVVNTTSNWALIFLALAAVAILMLKVFVSFRVQFPVLIFRAALLVVISFWMIQSGPDVFNKKNVVITQIAEFTNTEIR